jgi:hypothetical protein
MIETFLIFYEDDGQWVLLKKVENTLLNVLQEVYSYTEGKKYRLEKVTDLGNQVINFE